MEHANPATIFLILLFIGPVLFFIYRAKDGRLPYIRRIAGIDAMDEAIGRSVELGRPISFTTGISKIGPLLYACLGVFKYVATKTAVFGSRLLVPSSDPEVLVLCDATMQNAYQNANRSTKYDPTSLRFLSEEQFAYAAGYMGIVHRENVGSAFLFGEFAAESLILAEAGQQVGAVQVAATTSNAQVPFFLTSCDYTIIGEELYAAGALLSKDPVQCGSLKGQDIAKFGLLLILALGIGWATYLSITNGTVPTADEIPLWQWFASEWSDLF